MRRWFLVFLAFAMLITALPVVAADGGKTGVLTVDQDGLAVLGVCYTATPEDPPSDAPVITACDSDDGAQDGMVIVAGVPQGVHYVMTVSTIPDGCAPVEPEPFSQADATLINVVITCDWSSPAAIQPRLDLAALTLLPSDFGQSGWAHGGAFFETIDGMAQIEASYLGQGTDPEQVRATLISFGWQRSYVNVMELPSVLDASVINQRARAYVTEYADADGAAAGFGLLEDESTVPSASDVPASRTFGEQSEITKEQGQSAIDGRTYQSLDLTFRSGNLVAGVTLVVYPSKSATAPDQAELESLATILEGRLRDAAPSTGSAGLSVVRLDSFDHKLVTYEDAYFRLDGEEIPISGESSTATTLRTGSYRDAEDVYQLWLGVDIGSTRGYLYGVTVLEFPTDADATEWTSTLQANLGDNPFYGDLQPAGTVETIGDQTTALSYVAGGGSAGSPRAMLVAVRVGNRVARIHLVPQGGQEDVELQPMLSLVRAQAVCLAAGSCSGIVHFPDALSEAPTTATPVASPVS